MHYAASVEDTAHKVIEGTKERVERPRVKLKTKKMSLTIDKSKKAVQKKDSTGNITMETPRHSQPPFQPKQKSPEVKLLLEYTKFIGVLFPVFIVWMTGRSWVLANYMLATLLSAPFLLFATSESTCKSSLCVCVLCLGGRGTFHALPNDCKVFHSQLPYMVVCLSTLSGEHLS